MFSIKGLAGRAPVGSLARAHTWVYRATGARDLRLDLLRGFCIVVMIADHISGRSFLHWFTGGNAFYTSAAEGFVLISGLLLGTIYRSLIARAGLVVAIGKVLRRALTLYVLMAVLTVGLFSAGRLAGEPWAQTGSVPPITFVLDVLTFQRTFFMTDILSLYVILLLGVPIMLWLLHRGWTTALLVGSWALWLGTQSVAVRFGLALADFQGFHPAAWQLLFVHAIVLGYHQRRVREALTTSRRRTLLSIATLTLLGLLVVFFTSGLPLDLLVPGEPTHWLQAITLKDTLGPMRLVAASSVFTVFFALATAVWQPLQRTLGWLLLPLGQHSLYSYTMHVLLVFASKLLVRDVPGATPLQMLINTLAQLAAILIVWQLVMRRVLFAIMPR